MKNNYIFTLITIILLPSCERGDGNPMIRTADINNAGKAKCRILRQPYQRFVNDFKDVLRSRDKRKIAKIISYPLAREYPVPDIANEDEFIERYDHVFDEEYISTLLNSSTEVDWVVAYDWIGISFHGVWLNYAYVHGIRHSTKKEVDYYNELVNNLKNNIHISLREMFRPVAYLETATLKIQIDQTRNYKFRYAAWSIDKQRSDAPEKILNDGEINYYGLAPDHEYRFIKNEQQYVIEINCSLDGPPAKLKIIEREQVVFEQNATKLEN